MAIFKDFKSTNWKELENNLRKFGGQALIRLPKMAQEALKKGNLTKVQQIFDDLKGATGLSSGSSRSEVQQMLSDFKNKTGYAPDRKSVLSYLSGIGKTKSPVSKPGTAPITPGTSTAIAPGGTAPGGTAPTPLDASGQKKLGFFGKVFDFLKKNGKYALGPAAILIKAGVEAAKKNDLSTASQVASALLGPAGLIGIHGQAGVQSLLDNIPGGGAVGDILKDMGWTGADGGGGNGQGGMPADIYRFQKFNPEQQQGMSQLLQSGLSGLDPKAIEDYAHKQFESRTIPSLAERFTSLGGQNRLDSSPFALQTRREGSNLAGQLAGLRSNIAQNQLQQGLQPQFESLRTTPQPNAWDRLPGLVDAGVKIAPLLSKFFTGGI